MSRCTSKKSHQAKDLVKEVYWGSGDMRERRENGRQNRIEHLAWPGPFMFYAPDKHLLAANDGVSAATSLRTGGWNA